MKTNLPLRLYTTFYEDSSPERQSEYVRCLERNCANQEFEQIVLFVDDLARFRYLSEKYRITLVAMKGDRCSYEEMIAHANGTGEQFLLVMANTDIYFDDTLARLRELDFTNLCVCLTRYDVRSDGKAFPTEHLYSSDTWILATPGKSFACDIKLGVLHCESLFLGRARAAGYRVANAGISVRSYHLHLTQKRNYDPTKDKYSDNNGMLFPVVGSLAEITAEQHGSCEVLVDGAIFQLDPLGLGQLWLQLVQSWLGAGLGERFAVLDRGGSFPPVPGLTLLPAPPYNPHLFLANEQVLTSCALEYGAIRIVTSAPICSERIPTTYLYPSFESLYFQRMIESSEARDELVALRSAERMIVGHAEAAAVVRRFIGQGRARAIEVLSPELDPDTKTKDVFEEFRRQLQIPERFCVIVGERVGALSHRGVQRFGQMLTALYGVGVLAHESQAHECPCMVFVNGRTRLEMEIEASLRGIPMRHVTLPIEYLQPLLLHAVALIAPSQFEAVGFEIVNAQAVGCPVVAADTPFHRCLLEDDKCLFSPEEPASFLRALHVAEGQRKPRGMDSRDAATPLWRALKDRLFAK